MSDIMDIGGITVLPEYQAIFAPDKSDIFTVPDSTITVGENIFVPWGADNMLPQAVMEKIGKSEVVAQNLDHNIKLAYGQGPKPMMRRYEGDKVILTECQDERVLSFWEDNDIPGYFLEQCIDMNAFYNVFPEIILTKDMSEVFSIRHKEATFSRWAVADRVTGAIIKHGYSTKWGNGANESNTTLSNVLDRYNPYGDITNRVKNRSVKIGEARFIIPINFPTAGRVYYQEPPFWSIFKSGSYDYSMMLWEFKKLLIKQGIAIRYIIYISDKYWDQLFKDEKVDINNPDAVKKRKELEKQKFRDFLASEKNAGKGIMALKKVIPSGASAIEEKYITIEEVPSSVKGGEFLQDNSEVSNYISYAMGVFSSIVATQPGKNTGSLSGSDVREKYMIKAAMMAPVRDRLFKPLYFIKKYNKWPKELVFTVPDYEFTTLDTNKSGKQVNTPGADNNPTNANQ